MLTSLLANRASRMKASEIRELLKLLDQPGIISFAGGIPDPALFPHAAFQHAYAAVLSGPQRDAALQYQVSEGFLPLRAWIAAHMEQRGVACGIDNVFITSGSQQALDYLGKLFLSAGDSTLVEWPTYLGALQAFNAYEPHYEPLLPRGGNMTPEGYRAAAAAAGGAAKFAYLVPDFANPTGQTLTRDERVRVLDLAADLGIAVVEDAAYAALRYDGDAVPSLLALDVARSGGIEAARTIHCGSFSKILAPGLRVGWICAPRAIVERLVLIKQASDLHSPSINQMVVDHVARAVYAEQVATVQSAYRHRRDRMLDVLDATMPETVSWTRPQGGMFVWLTLPAEMDAAALLVRSIAEERVAFVPGSAFHADGSGRNTLRLSFSLADDAAIETGLTRLAALIRRSV